MVEWFTMPPCHGVRYGFESRYLDSFRSLHIFITNIYMKVCKKCELEKKLEEFSFDNKRNRTLSWCKECVREKNKIRYSNNREEILKKKEEYHLKSSEWFRELRENLKCERCGFSHPATLDFHHLDPSQKSFGISRAARNAWFNKEKILEEIKKCIVLCSNCHRIEHWNQK